MIFMDTSIQRFALDHLFVKKIVMIINGNISVSFKKRMLEKGLSKV